MKQGLFKFGFGPRAPSAADAERIDAIAAAHGAVFVESVRPGPASWFVGEERGDMFDDRLARAVWIDLEAAGLLDDDGWIRGAA